MGKTYEALYENGHLEWLGEPPGAGRRFPPRAGDLCHAALAMVIHAPGFRSVGACVLHYGPASLQPRLQVYRTLLLVNV